MFRENVDTTLGQLRNAVAAGKRWAIGTAKPSSHVLRLASLIFIFMYCFDFLLLRPCCLREVTPFIKMLWPSYVHKKGRNKEHIICVGKEPMVCFAAALGRAVIWHRKLYRI